MRSDDFQTPVKHRLHSASWICVVPGIWGGRRSGSAGFCGAGAGEAAAGGGFSAVVFCLAIVRFGDNFFRLNDCVFLSLHFPLPPLPCNCATVPEDEDC